MMKQHANDHLKKKYLAFVTQSPLLFTAPHTKKLLRGGKDYNQEIRTHKRELYTSFLACDFARATGKNSFLFWGKSKVLDETDLDPNYLKTKHFAISPFHHCLHNWASQSLGKPLMHVDIHGKMNRQKNCQIDVGILSMELHWQGDPLTGKIKKFFQKEWDIFNGYKFGKFECKFNVDPELHGYWGGDLHTMTEQAIMLGVPSLQLQIPMAVRRKLFRDQELRKKFHQLLRNLYESVVVPDFKERPRKYKVNEQFSSKFLSNVKRSQEESVYVQVLNFQKKQELNYNSNENI